MSDSDVEILKQLLTARGEFVSGNRLAESLGISRVGIWSRLEKLRGEGFQFRAVRNRGYSLVREPDTLHPALFEAYREILKPQPEVTTYFYDSIDSTNSEAERLLGEHRDCPFVVISSIQTSGRGRRGRVWHSADERNLYMSWAFRPTLSPSDMQVVTLWMGLCICQFLDREVGVRCGIKWPNDLLVEDRKLAGMLTEARVDAERMRDLIFGLGLNVHGRIHALPDEVRERATALSRHVKERPSINRIAVLLGSVVTKGFQEYTEGPGTSRFAALWSDYDALAGREVEAEYASGRVHGRAEGIDRQGRLLLREAESGRVHALVSGEVSVRPAEPTSRTP